MIILVYRHWQGVSYLIGYQNMMYFIVPMGKFVPDSSAAHKNSSKLR